MGLVTGVEPQSCGAAAQRAHPDVLSRAEWIRVRSARLQIGRIDIYLQPYVQELLSNLLIVLLVV